MMPMIVAISILIFLGGLIHQIFEAKSASQVLASEISGLHFQTAGTITSNLPAVSIPVRAPFQQKSSVSGKKANDQTHQTPTTEQNQLTRENPWKPGLRKTLEAGQLSYGDAVYYNLSARDVKKLTGYTEYARKNQANWSIGLYFQPEVTSYQDESLENTISYGISILPQLSFNRFFIQGGINLRLTHDKGNYSIDYNRYLGSYEDVYLVTFDSTENGVIPNYFTQTVEVYDTIDHYAISETSANYTYLEVPLMVGYRYEISKFSILLKAGPAASFMISRKLPPPGDPEENAKIINADYQVPSRYSVNWQFNLGAGFEYQLTDKINFGLEPTFRFALKPEYKLPDNTGWRSSSFGVRAGLRYNF